MGKLDIKTYLASHKGKPVNRLFYKIMRAFVAGPQAKKMNYEVIDNVGVKDLKAAAAARAENRSMRKTRFVV